MTQRKVFAVYHINNTSNRIYRNKVIEDKTRKQRGIKCRIVAFQIMVEIGKKEFKRALVNGDKLTIDRHGRRRSRLNKICIFCIQIKMD